MLKQTHQFYRVEGGRLLEIIEEHIAEQIRVEDVWRAFCDKHGTKLFVHCGTALVGLIFTGPVPTGWKAQKQSDLGVIADPDCTTEIGRFAYADCLGLPKRPHNFDLGLKLDVYSVAGPYIILERIAGAWVLGMPKDGEGNNVVPPPAWTPLKTSEVWRMWEDSEAEKMGVPS